jgi:hypothetical protein
MVAGIGDAGCSGVGHERDRRALAQLLDERRRARALHGVVVARDRPLDPMMLQQDARPARVLRGDEVDLAEHAQRAQRHVLEVPDRRRDDVEDAAGHGRP